MKRTQKIRILIASPGLDGHDRGAKVVAMALKDAGMEVIYIGIHRSAEEILQAAIQESVNYIGLSMLSGAHLVLTRQIIDRMKELGVDDIKLIVGGTIPKKDIPKLKEFGVDLVFPTQTPLKTIVDQISRQSEIQEKASGHRGI